MNAITNEDMRLRVTSKVFGIPNSSFKDHLYGRTTTRQKDTKPTLKANEEKNSNVCIQNVRFGLSTYSSRTAFEGGDNNTNQINILECIRSFWKRVASTILEETLKTLVKKVIGARGG